MLIAYFINSALVAMAVMIHYEMLYRLSRLMPMLVIKHRYRLVVGIVGALIAHIAEIWVFAFGYYLLIRFTSLGSLTVFNSGETIHNVMDCVYYSFVTYTTLGFGDLIPTGSLRFLTGLESLTGLVLITWTASFMYFEMQKYWDNQ
ncbi:MAG: two pore domain potassium channel family protein [Gammaproteobacteria bacterium]|nr:two pore domain potassium channel family protein [Gammaproteobacteria bacterium]